MLWKKNSISRWASTSIRCLFLEHKPCVACTVRGGCCGTGLWPTSKTSRPQSCCLRVMLRTATGRPGDVNSENSNILNLEIIFFYFGPDGCNLSSQSKGLSKNTESPNNITEQCIRYPAKTVVSPCFSLPGTFLSPKLVRLCEVYRCCSRDKTAWYPRKKTGF